MYVRKERMLEGFFFNMCNIIYSRKLLLNIRVYFSLVY